MTLSKNHKMCVLHFYNQILAKDLKEQSTPEQKVRLYLLTPTLLKLHKVGSQNWPQQLEKLVWTPESQKMI